jgi:TonB-dependent starch-binding outer membrane protein SusC
MKMHKILSIGAFALFPIFLWSQELTISGEVTESEKGEPLTGVNVRVKNAENRGTITNADGTFIIKAYGNDVLVVSFIGYQTVEVPIEKRSVLRIVMEAASTQLQNIITVGYGVQKKSQITGAIASVSGNDLRDKPVASLTNALQGRVSGLNIITTSGTPGAGLLVNIRGNNAPLFVVDGIPMLTESNSSLSTAFDLAGVSQGSGQTLNSLTDLNPNDIESVEVLKDASATAIYGARGANGVVLITTKRGQKGIPEVNFNYYTGVQQLARPIQFMDAMEFRELVEEARANDLAVWRKDKNAFGKNFDPSVLTEKLQGFNLENAPNTNWLDEITRRAPINNYEISLRSGDEQTRYYTSLSYFDQQGIVINNFYRRLNYRLNLDHNVNDRLVTGLTLNTTFGRNRRSFNDDTYSGIVPNALGASPFMPVREEDGSYASYEDYEASWLSDNPVKSANEIRAYTNNYRILGSAYGEYSFTPHLKLRTTWSADASFLFDNQYKSPLTVDAEAVNGEALESSFRNLTWLNENALSYDKQIGENSLSLVGVASFQRTAIERSGLIGQNIPTGFDKVQNAATQLKINGLVPATAYSLMSFTARANYDFKSKYMITASVRTDGSSRFAKDNRFATFPSVAVAWRLSNEDFFEFQREVFSEIKLRASYGLAGDQEIGDFQNRRFVTSGNYDGKPAIILRNIADPSLQWQVNSTFNIGADYEVQSGRFSGSLDFFLADKTRVLSEDAVIGTSGFATVTRNSGTIRNIGTEANINANILRGDFKWNAGANLTFLKNKILSLSNDNILVNAYSDLEATHILKVGQPIGSFYGLKSTGVNPQTGDFEFEDTNGDGSVDYDDAQVIGKAFPTLYGGISNQLIFKGLELNIFLRYSLGNQVYNIQRTVHESLGWSDDGGLSSVYANNSVAVRNRWKQPGDVAEYGRASFINLNGYQNSSLHVENGSFLRVQNVNLSYTFNNIPKIGGLRLYAEAQNLYVLTRYKGFDPEVSATGGLSDRTAGVDFGTYPQAKTFTIGVNLKF